MSSAGRKQEFTNTDVTMRYKGLLTTAGSTDRSRHQIFKLIPLELIHIFVLSIDIAVYLPLQLEVRYE
jgi:hypothetical protein